MTTLDVLSGGRARLGIGASWYEREQRGLGVPVVPVAERFERLEETLRICLQMWSDDNGPFTGQHYQLAETLCVPAPLSRPRPPIMIGGGGEKKTLRLVARYADAVQRVRHQRRPRWRAQVRRAARHCEAEGRDYDEIEKTVCVGPPGAGRRRRVPGRGREYAALGVTEVQADARPAPGRVRLRTGRARGSPGLVDRLNSAEGPPCSPATSSTP